jgi:hypothetical protein
MIRDRTDAFVAGVAIGLLLGALFWGVVLD